MSLFLMSVCACVWGGWVSESVCANNLIDILIFAIYLIIIKCRMIDSRVRMMTPLLEPVTIVCVCYHKSFIQILHLRQ